MRLRSQITGTPPPKISLRRSRQIFLAQTIVQSSGLFLLPLALITVLPFAWVYAFFQNATALDAGHDGRVWPLVGKSRQQAALWPMQNSIILLILSGFAFYVFLNCATFSLALPQLIKMLFGLDSIFTQSPLAMLNTTFFAAMFGLTYLCADPILKTVYTLRCFYGESIASGEDLKAELKPFAISLPTTAARALLFAAMLFFQPAQSAETNRLVQPPVAQTISPPALDQAIAQTIRESKYTWRMPREKMMEDDGNTGILVRFFQSIGQTVRHWFHEIFDWLQKMWRKIFPQPKTHSGNGDASGYGWIMSVEILLYALLAAAAAALGVFLYRVWRGRPRTTATVAEAVLPVPDLADENVRADQLPEDGWTKLAHELLARGELRLAMRAFYLASLAHLATRNLISIARFKSNRDYERELRRRAHAFPNLPVVFGENIFDFERIWYGNHVVNRERVDAFAARVARLKTTA